MKKYTNYINMRYRPLLNTAVNYNRIETVKVLLKCGYNPNVKDENGYTPLMTAVKYNNIENVKDLLKYGADPNKKINGYTPLMIAVNYNHIENVKDLLMYGADPNIQDQHGLTPLMRALCYNHIENVKILLKHGAYIENIQTHDGRTTTKCATNRTVAKLVIHEAIARRNTKYTINTLIASIPSHVKKNIFMKSKIPLNIDVMKHISLFI